MVQPGHHVAPRHLRHLLVSSPLPNRDLLRRRPTPRELRGLVSRRHRRGHLILTFWFAVRAARGDNLRWLLRLRIIVAIILAAIVAVLFFLPLPAWMVAEQATCGVLLLGTGSSSSVAGRRVSAARSKRSKGQRAARWLRYPSPAPAPRSAPPPLLAAPGWRRLGKLSPHVAKGLSAARHASL